MDGGTRKRERGSSSAQENRKKRPKKVQYSPSRWSSTSPESEIEELYMPTLLVASNFPLDVTEEKVKKFFKDKALDVKLVVREDDVCSIISFDSAQEATKGLKRNGKMLHKNPIYVARQGNEREIVCVSGFAGMDKKYIIKNLKTAFKPHGVVLEIFLPTNSTTGFCLGFGYIYMNAEVEKKPITISGVQVDVRISTLKKSYLRELLGKTNVLETEKTRLKKVLLPIRDGLHNLSAETFSWKERGPTIIPKTVEQKSHDCWAVALMRHYNSLLKILDLDKRPLRRNQLKKGVGPSHVVSGKGIDRLKHAIPFMKSIGCDMHVHNRPRGDVVEDFEAFEKFIERLLKKGPVMVSVEYSPGFGDFNGKGVYMPTDIDIYQRTFEKFSMHCLLLTGYGREDGKQHWQLQDSQGQDWGDEGFIRIERHKCLIKSVVELKMRGFDVDTFSF